MITKKYISIVDKTIGIIDGVCLIFANTEKVRNNDVDYVFRQDSDFLYLTGFEEPHAAILLDSQASGESQVTLFLREKDPERKSGMAFDSASMQHQKHWV